MTPKVGEVYMLDLGYQGKVRPIVIMSRERSSSTTGFVALCSINQAIPQQPV